MPAEYDPSSPFVSDMNGRLDAGTLQILNDVYAVRDPADMRRRLITPEIQTAHQILGAVILSETIARVFPEGIKPPPQFKRRTRDPSEIPQEDIALFDAAQGWTAIESASENGITILRARTLLLNAERTYDAKNTAEAIFKSIVQGGMVVVPAKSTLSPPMLLPKHIEMLGFIAQGQKTVEIADAIGASQSSVNGIINSTLKPLKANTRPAAVYQAFKKGIWQLPVELKQPQIYE